MESQGASMPYCYASGAGYGNYIERRRQPVMDQEAEQRDGFAKQLDYTLMRPGNHQSNGTRRRAVVRLEDGLVFPSILDAARAVVSQSVNGARSSINRACLKGGTASGYHWAYLADELMRRGEM